MGGIVSCKRRDEPPPVLTTDPQQQVIMQEKPKEGKGDLKLPVPNPVDPNDPKHHRLEFTPRESIDQESFKFFCPLCMCYLKVVWETSCCRNYTCYECAVTFLQGRKVEVRSGDTVPPGPFSAVPCPHCAIDPFGFVEVRPTAQPRRYFDSPSMHRAGRSVAFPMDAPSPVQPGDTADDLHRKMMRFGDFHLRKPSDIPAVPAAPRHQSQRSSMPQVPVTPPNQSAIPQTPQTDVVASMFRGVGAEAASSDRDVNQPNSPQPGRELEPNVVSLLTPDRPLILTNLDASLVAESPCKPSVINSPVLMPLTPSPFVHEEDESVLDLTTSTVGLSHALVNVPQES